MKKMHVAFFSPPLHTRIKWGTPRLLLNIGRQSSVPGFNCMPVLFKKQALESLLNVMISYDTFKLKIS